MTEAPMLERLFFPSSVALIGASEDELKSGGLFLKAMLETGFQGRLYPINRRVSELKGLKTYPSLKDVPGEIDLAVLALPSQSAPQIVEECVERKVKFLIIHTAGFKEIGNEGIALDSKIVEQARRGGMRIVGPNCMGIYSTGGKVNTISLVAPPPAERGVVSFIGHSGTLTEAFILSGAERGLRYNMVVSSGNESDLNTMDYFPYFAQDPQTKVIALYFEGMKWGRSFFQLAREITKQKPVIVWKAGRTPSGKRAAFSHTASLAVSDEVCEAAFRQAGIIRAQNVEDLVDYALAFSSPYLPEGNRVAIIGDSGGGGVSGGDACEMLGLSVPLFPKEIQQQLKDFLTGVIPPFSGIANPVDLVWPAYGDYRRIFSRCLEIMAPAVDAFFIFTYYSLTDPDFLSDLEQSRDRIKKPFFVIPAIPATERKGMSAYSLKGLPAYTSTERAARALVAMVRYARYLKEVQEGQSPKLVSAGVV